MWTPLAAAEGFFARHGGKIIVVARFVEGLRQANGIIAGLSGMPWRRFLGFNVLGAVLWVGLWSILGDLAGTHIDAIYTAPRRYELYLLAALSLLVLTFIARRVHRHRARRRVAEPATERGSEASTTGEHEADSDYR